MWLLCLKCPCDLSCQHLCAIFFFSSCSSKALPRVWPILVVGAYDPIVPATMQALFGSLACCLSTCTINRDIVPQLLFQPWARWVLEKCHCNLLAPFKRSFMTFSSISSGFSQSIYSASVREDVPTGSEVLRVLASDADDGRNADVRYSIRNASDLSFTIGETTGSIITTG